MSRPASFFTPEAKRRRWKGAKRALDVAIDREIERLAQLAEKRAVLKRIRARKPRPKLDRRLSEVGEKLRRMKAHARALQGKLQAGAP